MATAIASNRASSASIRRKTLSLFSLPGQGRKAGSSLNRNVAFNVALTGCFVMHFYSDSPMHLLSGLDICGVLRPTVTYCSLLQSTSTVIAVEFDRARRYKSLHIAEVDFGR